MPYQQKSQLHSSLQSSTLAGFWTGSRSTGLGSPAACKTLYALINFHVEKDNELKEKL